MLKRFATATLAVLLAVGGALLASSPAGGVAGFGDVPEQSFYTDAVQWMVDNDITTGTSASCFSPGDTVTRGQAAAFMWRMEGEPSAPAHSFTDVAAGYQQAPVSWMYANGITTGTSSSTYSPNDELTRGQLAALLHRLAGNPTASPHPFNDITASWQQAPVSWMAAASPVITTGTSATTFSPNDPVTRGQLAAFFWRYKGKPAVTIDPAHPTTPPCIQQVDGPTTDSSVTALELLDGLVVAVEDRSGYDRSLFAHWSDLDSDGCDTRQEVLTVESVVAVSTSDGCRVSSGEWLSLFDGVTVTDPSALDIDHLIPLAEAWDSGASQWDAPTRKAFANDQDDDRALIAVTASSNRSKSDRDPAGWLPPATSYQCTYSADWVAMKTRWSLSIDTAEKTALLGLLGGCPQITVTVEIIAVTPTNPPPPTTTTIAADCHSAYSPCLPNLAGDALNCGDLTSAQKPVTVLVIGVDPYNLDADNDGTGCTS